jgi:hypothetical protein
MLEPDATVSIVAERVDGLWTLWCVPDTAHSNADRVQLGSGPVGAGLLFPVDMLDAFWRGQQA